MAELTLKQIEDKLNEEFKGDTRKLVFWYDDKAEFINDIDTLQIENAKIYHLQADEQFKTKIFLERTDTTTNYLIYAPFSKPETRDNHLADTIKYSKEFFADRISLMMSELKIEEKYKPIMQKYQKFFAAKDRANRFASFDISRYNQDSIEIGIMSAICKTRTASFDEVLRVLVTDVDIDQSIYLTEFEKYGITEAFWRLCQEQFGYVDEHPSLNKLIISLFVTYTNRYMANGFPTLWNSFVTTKPGSVIAYLDNFMNNIQYRDRYNELSRIVSKNLRAEDLLAKLEPENFIDCDTFMLFDKFIIKWMIARLLDENLNAEISEMNIPSLCEHRMKKHFGDEFNIPYHVLKHAYYLVQAANYTCTSDFKQLVKQYEEKDYLVDTHYRKFYFYYDQLLDQTKFEGLRELVENIYTNKYLDVVIPAWNEAVDKETNIQIPLQSQFYDKYIRLAKDRVVVIISDAMRYEVGRNLVKQLERNPKTTATIKPMLGVLPSYTKLGMASLLPHRKLELTDDYRVLVDGKSTDDLRQREATLKSIEPNSLCIQFDDLKVMKRDELRQTLNGINVVYVYHNQIDARGDKANTENEVFNACHEAIVEIQDIIRRLTIDLSIQHYFITADHGFIYKRDKIEEAYKIDLSSNKDDFINRRFIVSKNKYDLNGTKTYSLSRITNNEDKKQVIVPMSSHVFKVSGGGQNYVHGGSSPQEMLIPLIEVKTERGKKETYPVTINLVSNIQKITNLITSFDFYQQEPISDVIEPTTYKLYFISDSGEKISNENIYVADKKDENPEKRIFRLQFSFKNKQYSRNEKYYLVVYDDKNEVELFRRNIIMDIAFAGDFGF